MDRKKFCKWLICWSVLFNLLWIVALAKNIYHSYKIFEMMHYCGFEDEMVYADWRVELSRGRYTLLATSRGSDRDSCFCYEEEGRPLFFCSTVAEDAGNPFSVRRKMVLAAPNFLLSWDYETNAVCSNIIVRYNGQDTMIDRVGDGLFVPLKGLPTSLLLASH